MNFEQWVRLYLHLDPALPLENVPYIRNLQRAFDAGVQAGIQQERASEPLRALRGPRDAKE